MIDEKRLEKAMSFLAETDHEFADAKVHLERAEIVRKRARAQAFVMLEGTVAERQAQAEMDAGVVTADEAYIAAVGTFERLKNQRHRAELVVEVWRSLEASRRRAA